MSYLLTVLTNGRRDCLQRTIEAFAEHVYPKPASVVVVDDGDQTGQSFCQELLEGCGFENVYCYFTGPTPVGMCQAYAQCWVAAAASEHEFVFHLEDDYVLTRPLDLDDLMWVLDTHDHLQQMALMRAPWGMEIEHGGYVAQMPGYYLRLGMNGDRVADAHPSNDWFGIERPDYEWMETRRNWTNGPSLFRSSLAEKVPWPTADGCETAIGPAILAACDPAAFGIWGWGEAWCAHVGVERAAGARGY